MDECAPAFYVLSALRATRVVTPTSPSREWQLGNIVRATNH